VVNYEQARQLGKDSDAPGCWNWSLRNDDVIYTTWPCHNPTPERERCDHETREEAERHHWEAQAAAIEWHPFDVDAALTLHRCDFPGCGSWADGSYAWFHGWEQGEFCVAHSTPEAWREANPFTPGHSEIHS